jgi:hypothetical protein
LKIEGNAEVRRFFASRSSEIPAGNPANKPARSELKDTPAIRRIAPRNVSEIFMMFYLVSNSDECGDSRSRLSIERSSMLTRLPMWY